MSKQYGLIVPNKDKPKPTSTTTIQRPSIFDDSDDDGHGDNDDNSNDKRPQIGLKRPLKKQDKINQQRAIEQDPTVYQYDEIYDDMDRKRKESKLLRKDLERKPKYINKLLEAAERRKKEYERRIERQIQKEREAEGEEFKDKESFVTSAYRRKLEEMKQMDELEKREEYLENIGDVRKQQNLDGFYRHLFQQKVNYDDDNHGSHSNKQQNNDQIDYDADNKNSSHSDKQKNQVDYDIDDDNCGSHSNKQNNDSDHSSNENKQNNIDDNDNKQENIKKSQFKQRQYRKRDNSNNSDIEIDNNPDNNDNDKIDNKREHLPSNLDADSDFSIDSSTDDDDDDVDKDKNKKQSIDDSVKQEKIDNIDDKQPTIEEINVKNQDGDVKMEEIVEDAATPPPIKKPKIDIWKKRTIDDVYQAALQRYFERKALRDL